jgi:DNA-binding response OmpR family regulator
MSGRELAERLVARWPETPVLYMSGYLDDTILRHGVDGGGQSLLQKPFTPAVLLGRVRDALDARLVAAAPLAVC